MSAPDIALMVSDHGDSQAQAALADVRKAAAKYAAALEDYKRAVAYAELNAALLHERDA